MSAYGLGLKAIVKLCLEQDPLEWHRAKLRSAFFKAHEVGVFDWVQDHLSKHHALPNIQTVVSKFPDVQQLVDQVPEPVSYYVQQIENRYFYDRINHANLKSQEILQGDPTAYDGAALVLRDVLNDLTEQRFRLRITDLGSEGVKMVEDQYNSSSEHKEGALFGWPYLDSQGSMAEGEIVSIVGRPMAGKTWLTLHMALVNWRLKYTLPKKRKNVLVVSMEMMPLPIMQRLAAMYTGCSIGMLKGPGFGTHVGAKFKNGLMQMQQEESKLYVVDGNLAASVIDIYELADMLHCHMVLVDGAYLLKHKNLRLDRYTRVAENVELMKHTTTDLGMVTGASWQFGRKAAEKGKKGGDSDDTGLEDIGYSDAIGQVSSVVLGLFQEQSVETLTKRKIKVLKGRNGETGEFSIAWDFSLMDFSQVDPPLPTSNNVVKPPEKLKFL
jgi:replicative DNA helicase